jgi:hypothetical protein
MEISHVVANEQIAGGHPLALPQVFEPGFDHEILDEAAGLRGVLIRAPADRSVTEADVT